MGAGPVIRESREYAVVEGVQYRVDTLAHDAVWIRLPTGEERRNIDSLDDLVKVRTTATWRGGRVIVSAVAGDECGFYTDDGDLAAAQGLQGDTYNGWRGSAPLAELTDIEETVRSIHPQRRTS